MSSIDGILAGLAAMSSIGGGVEGGSDRWGSGASCLAGGGVLPPLPEMLACA
jgi:hypothetical protein